MARGTHETCEEIVICICTYRRPRELERLLESLDKLRFSKINEPQISVIVVENDANADARAVCEKYERLLRWPLRYAIETKPGISHARNCCLSLVADGTDFVVFIDDDETVTANWLESLLLIQRSYAAHVVTGPVLPIYEIPPPEWVRKGGFHDRLRHDTGAVVPDCATGNVLISKPFINKHLLEFDPEFGLIGGSDTLFFRMANRRGAKKIWCDEAVAYEYVPPNRVTVSAILQRSFRVGITNSNALLRLDGQVKGHASSLWRGVTRLLAGSLLAPFAMLGGRAPMLRALCRAAYGLGSLLGGFGYTYQYYRRDK